MTGKETTNLKESDDLLKLKEEHRKDISPKPAQEISEDLNATNKEIKKATNPSEVSKENQKEIPEGYLSFSEAEKLLEGKLDIVAARDKAVEDHKRWGYVDALIERGKVDSPEQYAKLFDSTSLREKDIKSIASDIDNGRTFTPIFDAGLLLPHEQWDILFKEAGIPCSKNAKNFHKIKKVSPENFKAANVDIDELYLEIPAEQMELFKKAYKKAPELKPTGARVIFTPGNHEVTNTYKSASKDIKVLAKNNGRILDIGASILLLRAQIDENRENMPEETISCSDCVLPNGGTVSLEWNRNRGQAILSIENPDDIGPNLGSRPALG